MRPFGHCPPTTVFYSYTFRTMPPTGADADFGEADFVVVHPFLGYLVLEVKQGKVGFANGQWYEEKQARQQPMGKDPVAQAIKAMYTILNRYKEKAKAGFFPLRIRYGSGFLSAATSGANCPPTWGTRASCSRAISTARRRRFSGGESLDISRYSPGSGRQTR
jgi:hypothetical protein